MKKLILILSLLVAFTTVDASKFRGPNAEFKPMVKMFGKSFDKVQKKLEKRHKNDSMWVVSTGRQKAIKVMIDHKDWTEIRLYQFRGNFLTFYSVTTKHEYNYWLLKESYRYHVDVQKLPDTRRMKWNENVGLDLIREHYITDKYFNIPNKFCIAFTAEHKEDAEDEYTIWVYRSKVYKWQ